MKRHLNTLALAGLLAAAAPAWAQAPVTPTSPNDPASKSLGWVEAAPGSQAANPASAAAEPGPAPGSGLVNPPPAATQTVVAPTSQPANPPPPTPEARPAAGSQKTNPASETTEKISAPRPKQAQQRAREEHETPRDRGRSTKASDNMANQLNRQELGSISAGTPAPAAARR